VLQQLLNRVSSGNVVVSPWTLQWGRRMSVADSSKGVILAACPLQKGVAAAITQAFYRRGWDICGYDQYVDHEKRHFFARVEWEPDRVPMNADDLQAAFREEVADVFGMQWSFWPGGRRVRLAIFVTDGASTWWGRLAPVTTAGTR
jgi:formyltetrahydrofolate hydrolase